MTEWNLQLVKDPRCRMEFEAWARAHGFEVIRMMSMDAYFSGATDHEWNEWQKKWTPDGRPHV